MRIFLDLEPWNRKIGLQLGAASLRGLLQALPMGLGDTLLEPLCVLKGGPREFGLVRLNGDIRAFEEASDLSLRVVGVSIVPPVGGG